MVEGGGGGGGGVTSKVNNLYSEEMNEAIDDGETVVKNKKTPQK